MEKHLKDEQLKRKAVEDKLFIVVQKQSTHAGAQSGEKDLFEIANEELRKKDRQVRDTTKRLDIFEGRDIDKRSKQDLQHAQKQL